MWLVSSCAWAKGLSDVKTATDPEQVVALITACDEPENRCREVYDPKVSGLNTSVVGSCLRACERTGSAVTTTVCLPAAPQAFGFINLILWIGNLWFVFKETGWMAAFAGTYVPSQEKQPAPDSFGQGGYGQQDPYAGSQGGYQPDYGQQGGYSEDGGYSQGYEQQPTSYSNQM